MARFLALLSLILFVSFGNAQWLPQKEQEHLKIFWPKGVEFPEGAKFYELEPAYQTRLGGRSLFTISGVHSPLYNISAVSSEPFGNANREFPWRTPAGLHNSPNFLSYKFVKINGPIEYWTEDISNQDSPVTRWKYPPGTIFGDLLMVTDKQGYAATFEIRTRTKLENGSWRPKVFRPFQEINELPLEWRPSSKFNITKPTLKIQPIKNLSVKHQGFGINDTISLVKIGPAPLNKLNVLFKEGRGLSLTTEDWSIVPKNYTGHITSCVKCHQQTLIHAREIQPNRDWYGFVRGDDTIFSFHIFDESCISHNGFNQPVVLNRNLNLQQTRK